MNRKYSFILALLLSAIIFVGCTDTGNISGSVTTAAGAPISNAGILAVNSDIYFRANIVSTDTIDVIKSKIAAAGGSFSTASSGTDGTYLLSDQKIGQYIVVAAYTSIKVQTVTLATDALGCSPAKATADFQF